MPRIIFHIDVNSAFVSWSATKLVLEDKPDIRLTHESAVQMSLFEDPKMEYYREWDRQFDEDHALYEDAKMLAYERKKAPKDDALVFCYPDGEQALAAAKKAISPVASVGYNPAASRPTGSPPAPRSYFNNSENILLSFHKND